MNTTQIPMFITLFLCVLALLFFFSYAFAVNGSDKRDRTTIDVLVSLAFIFSFLAISLGIALFFTEAKAGQIALASKSR